MSLGEIVGTVLNQSHQKVKKRIKYVEVKVPVAGGAQLDSPEVVFELIKNDFDGFQEELYLIIVDCRLRLIKMILVAKGSANTVSASPSDVFRIVLMAGSSKFMIAHNHPSGECEPSEEDVVFTKKLSRGAELLGVKLLDHLIVGDEKFYSFKRAGLI